MQQDIKRLWITGPEAVQKPVDTVDNLLRDRGAGVMHSLIKTGEGILRRGGNSTISNQGFTWDFEPQKICKGDAAK